MTNRIRKYRWGRWLVFLVALEIIALSINFFYAPIDIAAGGRLGLPSWWKQSGKLTGR